MNGTVLHCTVLHCTVLHWIALQVDDDDDTKQLPLMKDEGRGGRRHPQKQGSAIDLDIGAQMPCLSLLWSTGSCHLKNLHFLLFLSTLAGPPLEPNQARNYKTIQQILYRMNRMCVQVVYVDLAYNSSVHCF